MHKARLIFEDGQVFYGKIFTDNKENCYGEVVFNTAMTGYQEVLTDPSYHGQMVLFTYPLIGSYGVNPEDIESKSIFLEAILVKEYMEFPSNWRQDRTLKQYLDENNIVGAEGFDTRAITKYVREKGAQKTVLTASEESLEKILAKVKAMPGLVNQDIVKDVTTKKEYVWKKLEKPVYKLAVIDCGVKYNILRVLTDLGCECTVFPYTVSAQEILAQDFDGLFLSNGPGDPEPITTVIKLTQDLLGKMPIFGICLGQQILGLACGCKTYKLKFGHHGVNHPVKNLKTKQVEITSQNHGFCIDQQTLSSDLEVTHINLNDQSIEGIRHKVYPAFAVQYHPEASPGPNDANYLFKDFMEMIKGFKKNR
ncbi:glutamine-hydrolyzing carbamoyl-phosphate synthase small subunit [bacterium]|nr:glutamine-hydrolyzing carbamoyl-phosphate synthase small subunit [bacterium]